MALVSDENTFRPRLMEKIAQSITEPIPLLTPRHVVGPVTFQNKATAVIGMRRAGKTTFLHQQRRAQLDQGASQEQLPYLNFEDEQLTGMEARDLGLMVDEYYRRFPDLRNSTKVTWCLDEIQVIPGWERFVRRMLDSENAQVFISGSSAALLSREIATAMRGRSWEVVIHPFSFGEFLQHNRYAIPPDAELLTPAQRSKLENAFLTYLREGGFPEAQGLDAATRQRLLTDYVDVAMLRDIAERHNVTNIAGLGWMVRHLLANAASLFSVEKFYAALKSQGISISKDTVHQLLGYIEDCFLVRTVWIDSDSERRRMVNPRKAYPIDPGLIPVYDRSGKANLGHALETAVLIELERRNAKATYVRTGEGYEVDFLARYPSGQMELIQVCADLSTPEICEREVRALEIAGKSYPGASKLLLTATRDAVAKELPAGVKVRPAYEWMLTSY